jgi:hypothetical protein
MPAASFMESVYFGIKKWVGEVILYLTGISWLALFLLRLHRHPGTSYLCLSMDLGMIWGIIFFGGTDDHGFYWRRPFRQLYFSSGFVKSVAEYIRLHFNITELWVPFTLVSLLPSHL